MIAAIDARKSTEENGVGDDEKSVARQVEHAKAYAIKKDWTVAEEHVYVADGGGRAARCDGREVPRSK